MLNGLCQPLLLFKQERIGVAKKAFQTEFQLRFYFIWNSRVQKCANGCSYSGRVWLMPALQKHCLVFAQFSSC